MLVSSYHLALFQVLYIVDRVVRKALNSDGPLGSRKLFLLLFGSKALKAFGLLEDSCSCLRSES